MSFWCARYGWWSRSLPASVSSRTWRLGLLCRTTTDTWCNSPHSSSPATLPVRRLLDFQDHDRVIGHLLLALRVGVAAGRDARQHGWRCEGVIQAETGGRHT